MLTASRTGNDDAERECRLNHAEYEHRWEQSRWVQASLESVTMSANITRNEDAESEHRCEHRQEGGRWVRASSGSMTLSASIASDEGAECEHHRERGTECEHHEEDHDEVRLPKTVISSQAMRDNSKSDFPRQAPLRVYVPKPSNPENLRASLGTIRLVRASMGNGDDECEHRRGRRR